MSRSVMWAFAVLAAVACVVPSAHADWLPTSWTSAAVTTVVSGNSTTVVIPSWVTCPTCTYVYVLPDTNYCGGCIGNYKCCHVGSYVRPSYQCVSIHEPVVPVAPCSTCTAPKPVKPVKPVKKTITVVPTYCKCGTGAACCQVAKSYKCVPVYTPKPVKCGARTCKAGFYCPSKGKFWKLSKCARTEYTWHHKY